MALVPDHPHSEEDQTHEAAVQPCPRGSHSSRSRTHCRRKNDDSVERSLAMVHEAHQKSIGHCLDSRERDRKAEPHLSPFAIKGQV